jgi:hypothetical protein
MLGHAGECSGARHASRGRVMAHSFEQTKNIRWRTGRLCARLEGMEPNFFHRGDCPRRQGPARSRPGRTSLPASSPELGRTNPTGRISLLRRKPTKRSHQRRIKICRTNPASWWLPNWQNETSDALHRSGLAKRSHRPRVLTERSQTWRKCSVRQDEHAPRCAGVRVHLACSGFRHRRCELYLGQRS